MSSNNLPVVLDLFEVGLQSVQDSAKLADPKYSPAYLKGTNKLLEQFLKKHLANATSISIN